LSDPSPFSPPPVSPRKPAGSASDPGRAIDRIIVNLWATIEDLEHLQPEERFFRATIFGSARITPSDEIYHSVRETAASLARLGCDIVTGGGPGLMAAANEGAKSGDPSGRIRSIGLTIDLPNLEEGPNPYLDRIMAHRTFFSRLHHFVRMSQAFLVFPGGIGTALESFMTWQLVQVGMLRERPVVFVGEHWRGLLEWMKETMLKGGYLNPRDFDLVSLVDDPKDAVAIVAEAKKAFDARRPPRILRPAPGSSE
jgi:uncharacterized protein (TIGR00730 family)